MQRVGLTVGVIIIGLGGCVRPTRVSTSPLPPPLLETRRLTPPRIAPAPVPRQLPRVVSSTRLNERELIPPGGIKRGRWNVIVVHHSANRNDTLQSMDDYHRKVRKWVNGLGYHFVIGNGVNTEDGRVYVGSRWKRQIAGAHCKSSSGRYFGAWRAGNYFNTHGIGICLIGDFEQRGPTSRQLAILRELTRFLCSRTRINPAHIYGHRDVTHKTACPGRYLSGKLPQLRAAVAQALAVTLDTGPPPGWPSGADDQLATCPDAYLHRALPTTYARAETGNVAHRSLGHALDHVTDLDRGPLRRAVLGNFDHHHAE